MGNWNSKNQNHGYIGTTVYWLPGYEGDPRAGHQEMIPKEHKENLGDDGFIHYYDCGVCFIGIYINENVSNCIV